MGSEASAPLFEVGFHVYVLFMFYIAFFFIVTLNMITSLFLEIGTEVASNDRACIMQEQLENLEEQIRNLTEWCSRLDLSPNGEITYEQFCAHMEDKEMLCFARSLEIDLWDLKQFFNAVSAYGTRTVDLQTFIVGCIKMQGNAKSLDLQDVKLTLKKSLFQQVRLEMLCQQQLETLQRMSASMLLQAQSMNLVESWDCSI